MSRKKIDRIKRDWAKAWKPKPVKPKTVKYECSNCGNKWRRSVKAPTPAWCRKCGFAFPEEVKR